MRQRLWKRESRPSSLHPLMAKIQKLRGTVVDRDLLGALGEGPWGILFFHSTTPACASAGYSKKSKNLKKPANVGDRRFPQPKGGLPRGWYHFEPGYTTSRIARAWATLSGDCHLSANLQSRPPPNPNKWCVQWMWYDWALAIFVNITVWHGGISSSCFDADHCRLGRRFHYDNYY